MTDPREGITLSLQPKPQQGNAPQRKTGSPAEALPAGVDGLVLDELREATRTYDYLRQFGEPIELWEAVRLARAHRGVHESPKGDAAAPPSPEGGMAEELQAIRKQLSPMVRDLRRFLTRVPDLPPAGESLELALGFLLASSKEHKAVAKWLAESDGHLEKAASKLRSLATIAAPYLDVLRPWTLDGKPLVAIAPAAKSPSAPAPAAAPSVPLDIDFLDTLRRAVWCRRLFSDAQLEASFWEVLLLNAAERIPTQARQVRIVQAKKDNQLTTFHEETRNLHARVLPLRARHGRWVEVLRAWLRELPGVPADAGEFELALAFAVVEPDGQERARRWLGTPEAHAKAAAAHMTGLAAKAKTYVRELKKPPA